MSNARPEVLLLDAGGTVVFLDASACEGVARGLGIALAAAVVEKALPIAAASYARAVASGASHEDGWSLQMHRLLEVAGISATDAERLLPALRAEHDRFNLWRRVPEGLPGAVAAARAAGMRVGVVSNSEGKLPELFARVGLDEAFDLVVDSALEGVRKPDPELFWRACRRLGVAPERCLYAGDLPEVDLAGAARAGMAAVLVDPLDLHPDVAPRVRSVAELVARLLGGEPF